MQLLSRNDLRSIVGGSEIDDVHGCGKCDNPGGGGTTGCYKQSGGPTDGECRCMFQQQSCA